MSPRSLHIAILFATFLKAQSQDILALLKDEVHEPVAQCVTEVANTYFRDASAIGVALIESNADYDDSLLRTIAANARWSLLILSAEDCLNEQLFVDHSFSSNETVVRVDEMLVSGRADDVVRFLEVCDVRMLISERSRFVVGLDEPEGADAIANVRKVLDALWVLDQVNVAVLIMTVSKSVDIYSWFPITDDAKPYVLDSCINGSFKLNTNLFPSDKISTDLQGFRVRFGAVMSPPFVCKAKDGSFIGFEVNIYEALAEKLNFTPEYHFSQSDKRFEETLDGVRRRDLDVTVGGFLQKAERFRGHGVTTTFLRDTVEWYVGGDWVYTEIDQWSFRVVIFNMAVYFLTTLTMKLLFKMDRRKKQHSRSVWLLIWSLWAEAPTLIRFMSGRQKVFWAFCAFYIVNMNAMTKSVITTVMTQPLYTTEINTVHQLYESDVPILAGSPSSRRNLFPDEEKVNGKRVQARLLQCPDTRTRKICLGQQLEKGPLSILVLQCFMKVITDFLPKGLFHALERPVSTLQMISYTRRNYFLLPEFRRRMSRFIEVGLVQHWQLEFERHPACDMALGHWKKVKGDEADVEASSQSKYATITFVRMRGVFKSLLIAYGLSALVLLYEIVSYQYTSGGWTKKRSRKKLA